MKQATIVGGGLTGPLVARLLAREGWQCRIFERYSDPRGSEPQTGRSINLALAERGWRALRAAGLAGQVATFALPMRGRMIHTRTGELELQPYGQHEGEVIYSVHRARLNQCLLDGAQQAGVEMAFDSELAAVDLDASELEIGAIRHHYDLLIGCDGAASIVREALEKQLGFASAPHILAHGYKELTIPPEHSAGMDFESLHIWPRDDFMCIALPNPDRSFTCTLFLGNQAFEEIEAPQAARAFFDQQFPDLVPLLPDFDSEWQQNPVGLLGSIDVPHWHYSNAIVIGDAAHPIVPFHGQGMNAGFEDALELARALGSDGPLETKLRAFASRRKPDADAITQMALENYREMRADVIDERYQRQRALALELGSRFPERFVPRYNQVMFRTLPYAEVLSRGVVQKQILNELIDCAGENEAIDYSKAAELIARRLAPLPTPAP